MSLLGRVMVKTAAGKLVRRSSRLLKAGQEAFVVSDNSSTGQAASVGSDTHSCPSTGPVMVLAQPQPQKFMTGQFVRRDPSRAPPSSLRYCRDFDGLRDECGSKVEWPVYVPAFGTGVCSNPAIREKMEDFWRQDADYLLRKQNAETKNKMLALQSHDTRSAHRVMRKWSPLKISEE
jgi:hypothetical protein